MLLKIEPNTLPLNKIDYYLKAVSFLLRSNNDSQGEVNFMFYYQLDKDTFQMLPSERGVDNGIRYDQTNACGSGSAGLGNYIIDHEGLKKVYIKNRSGNIIGVQKEEKNIQISIERENICELQQKKQPLLFQVEAILENFSFHLSQLGIETQGKSYQDILDSYQKHFPSLSLEIRKKFGNILFSSCLHESEFPIDPYKMSSSINGSMICEGLQIDTLVSPYLDTMAGNLTTYPNVKTKNGKMFNNANLVRQETFYLS